MNPIFLRVAKHLLPDLFAPNTLRGLPPSWSGVISRIISPSRIVSHPIYGVHKITVISRDEERRLAKFQFQELINKYPHGSYNEFNLYESEKIKK